MLKHKLKRWLHENEPDGGGVKPEPGSPRMSTPPLPRSPSGSAVNRYPSLKTKLLGPKLEPASPGGSNDSSKENGRVCNGNEGAYTSPFASTQNLAAAASFATGLPCGKRARDYEKFKPASPAKVARVRDEALEADARAESPKPSNRSKPSTPKPAKPRPSPKPKPSGGPASSGGSDGSEPKEETDEEVARRLHQEFNCAPARASRGRGRMGAQEAADDPVHGQDPGILPSCCAMVTQSRTKTVPYGFICGFPVGGVSSELYGFYEGQGGKSGAQGDAVLAAMKKWGENEAGTAGGTELGFAVCKRGYRPFGEDGERRFGCVKHSARRLEAMRRAPPRGSGAAAAPDPETGLYHRPGWERFDQWVFGEKTTSGSTAPSESRSAEEEEDQDAGAASRSPPREKKRSRLAVAATA